MVPSLHRAEDLPDDRITRPGWPSGNPRTSDGHGPPRALTPDRQRLGDRQRFAASTRLLYGQPVSLDFHFHSPKAVTCAIESAGFAATESTEREPYEGAEHP